MSLEKDAAEIKRLVEKDEPIFKPAGKDNLVQRRAARDAEIARLGIIPVDNLAGELDGKAWEYLNKLKNQLGRLTVKYKVSICECWKKLEKVDEDMETCEIPGENGYCDRYCLRCGGYVEI